MKDKPLLGAERKRAEGRGDKKGKKVESYSRAAVQAEGAGRTTVEVDQRMQAFSFSLPSFRVKCVLMTFFRMTILIKKKI